MNQAIAALRDLGVRAERPVLEVSLADDANVVLAAAATEAERVGAGEAGELGGVGAGRLGGVETLEVDVERGPVVERVHAVARALGHQHRVADRRQPCWTPIPSGASEPIAMPTTASRSTSRPCNWKVSPIGQLVAGAAADQRDHGAGDVVGAADDVAAGCRPGRR